MPNVLYFDSGSYIPGWPGTHCVAQVGLESQLYCPCLPSAGITGMYHHAGFIFQKFKDTLEGEPIIFAPGLNTNIRHLCDTHHMPGVSTL
jgi:hypothetical protein